MRPLGTMDLEHILAAGWMARKGTVGPWTHGLWSWLFPGTEMAFAGK